jgi:hypothetical protein
MLEDDSSLPPTALDYYSRSCDNCPICLDEPISIVVKAPIPPEPERVRSRAACLNALQFLADYCRASIDPADARTAAAAERLRLDAETFTVTMDGLCFSNLDPTAFRALEVLWSLFREKRRPISSRELCEEPGLTGKNLRREFACRASARSSG